jgi:TolB-like protein
MPDVFLSYNREDQATAQRFAEGFEAHGLSVWWDVTLRSGETYDTVTEEALRTAKAVVVLWSKKSVTSRWVRAEATLADRNRTLVPARIGACDLPVMFELTQTADLSGWNGDANSAAWRAFLADVRRFVEAGAAPRPPVPRPSPQAEPTPPPDRTVTSIAVLPFVNRSGRDEDDVFADGIVEDLTTALSTNARMKVVASRATATYRNAAVDLRQIGRDLGVRYLLEGNVRRVGADLRVTAQLVEAQSGNILWTQKFDRPLAELSSMLDELVTDVALELSTQLELAEGRPPSRHTIPTRSGWTAAVAERKRAVEIDPRDGFAYASLAATQTQLLHFPGGDDPKLAQEIAENIRRARALGSDNPRVISVCAGALIGLGRAQEALPLAERAIALNPQDGQHHFILGSALARLGRSDEALAAMDDVERLAPNTLSAHRSLIWRSVAHLQAGRLDEALDAADRSLGVVLGPDPLVQSMLCLAKLGRWNDARDAMRRLLDADPEMSCALVESLVRHIYGGSDATEDYVEVARKFWGEAAGEPGSA